MGTESSHGHKDIMIAATSQVPIVSSAETNTEVLIVMLSIISGISAVLLIILIVVCVRCHVIQASHADSVFSDPSPGLQAHYKYISSLESEKTRPQLADGYCEVADALPFTQRGETPTSPAYAEVEQFAHLRKTLWSSSSEDGLRGSKSAEIMHGDSEVKNADEKQKDIGVSSETTKQKRGVLGRRKCEKVKHADQEKTSEKRLSIGPKIIPVTASKQSSSSSAAESLHSTLNPPVSNADDSCPTYEKFGDISQTIQSSTLNQKSLVAHKLSQNVGIYDTDIHAKNCSFENYSQTLGRVKDNAKHLTENSNGTQQLFLEEPEPPKKPPRCLNKSISADYSKWSKTLPCRSLKTSLQASGNKNSSHVHVGKDVLQTAGIVKNGIKKFEQTSS